VTAVTGSPGDSALAEAARRFTSDRFSLESLRTRRDDPGFVEEVRERWSELGTLGWAGMLVPARCGGSEASWVDVGIVLGALGSTLAITPMVSTGVVSALLLGADPDRFGPVLDAIASGSTCSVIAHDETAHFGREAVTATATSTRDGFVVEGAKEHVVFGPVGDRWLVSARLASDGDGTDVGVFLVEPDAPGITRSDGVLVDGRPVSSARFVGTAVPREALVTDRQAVLAHALAAGALAEGAAMIGGARRALGLTVSYLRHREQFGVPIGAFQALQHRAARLHCAVTVAEALTERALEAWDAGDSRARRFAHAAKAKVSETYLHVAEEGVQMHGGIGMTDEAEIGFHLVAARVGAMELGDARYHRRVYAELAGY
jgi:alkylation response protein AidB-like acyl-CoA dehydrogenase